MKDSDIKLLEQYQTSKLNKDIESEDEDDIFKQLEDENDTELSKFRESRMQQLSKEFKRINQHESNQITELYNEKELMQLIIDKSLVLIHFYQINFDQCKSLNSVLELMKQNHPTTEIYIIQVENCPFLINKLNLKVLPALFIYKNGLELDKLIGFTKLGNELTYNNLETYLLNYGILNRKSINRTKLNYHSNAKANDSEGSDLDI
ncbi:unnamed protein product [Candida verbasci]|uniref:Phosducin domain-containing protein n=1 Tax=Candida verbasci TaxID=1227364 RepID=A0A9W4TZV3_9ASCO|nr:unnamed protein product [Candida verbasci]